MYRSFPNIFDPEMLTDRLTLHFIKVGLVFHDNYMILNESLVLIMFTTSIQKKVLKSQFLNWLNCFFINNYLIN